MGVRCSVVGFHEIKMKHELNMQVYQNQNEIMEKGRKMKRIMNELRSNCVRTHLCGKPSVYEKMKKPTRPLGDYIKPSSADH